MSNLQHIKSGTHFVRKHNYVQLCKKRYKYSKSHLLKSSHYDISCKNCSLADAERCSCSSTDDVGTGEAVHFHPKVFAFRGPRAALMQSTSVGSESCGCRRVDKQSRTVRDLCLCTTNGRKVKIGVHLHAHVMSYQIKL